MVSLVPTTLQRLLDAGLRDPPRCAGRCWAARRRPTRCRAAPRPRACRVAPTYGLTEACSQVTHARARRCSARRCASPPTARSSSAARPSRRGSGPSIATGDLGEWGPDGALRDPRAQGRHDHLRRREHRARRGRGGPRGASRRRRGRGPRPRRRGVGGGGRRHRGGRARRSRPRICARGAPRAWPRSRCPRRSRSPRRCRAPHRASCVRGAWTDRRCRRSRARRASSAGRDGRRAGRPRGRDFQHVVEPVSRVAGRRRSTRRPGQRVLELAAGLGDTGLLAAAARRPGRQRAHHRRHRGHGRRGARARRGGRGDERRTTGHAGRVDRPAGGVRRRRAVPLRATCCSSIPRPRCARRAGCCKPGRARRRSRSGTRWSTTRGWASSATRWPRAASRRARAGRPGPVRAGVGGGGERSCSTRRLRRHRGGGPRPERGLPEPRRVVGARDADVDDDRGRRARAGARRALQAA